MKNTYLIFPDSKDVYNYCKIICLKERFKDALIEAELINPDEDLEDLSWVIFENGEMIKG